MTLSKEPPASTKPGNTRRILTCLAWLAGAAVLCMLLLAGCFELFSAAKLSAPKSTCQSNLKQLGGGLLMYAEDYDNRFPPAKNWQDGSFTYVRSEYVYVCPSRPKVRPGYAFNQLLGSRALKSIAAPDQTPTLVESRLGVRNGRDLLESFILPHHGSSNVLFADGRVQAVRAAPAADAGLAGRQSPPGDRSP